MLVRYVSGILLAAVLLTCIAVVDAAQNQSRGTEGSVYRNTMLRSKIYFEGRTAIGNKPKFPFLCYSLLSKQREYSILMHNMEVLGYRCDWVLTFKIDGDLSIEKGAVESAAKEHGSAVVAQELANVTGMITKTASWRHNVLPLTPKYSHVWLIDADIEFSSDELQAYLMSWMCGSVAGAPPLISQPTIRSVEASRGQDYLEVNHYEVYSGSKLSMIGSEIVENQVVLIDASFFNWYYREAIIPFFSRIKYSNQTDWGLSRTWCRAAEGYKALFSTWLARRGQKARRAACACGIIPQPVLHRSTHSIKKTGAFRYSGLYTNYALKIMFPIWSVDQKKHWHAQNIVALRNNIKLKKSNSTSSSSRGVLHSGKATAYIKRSGEASERFQCAATVSGLLFNSSRIFFWSSNPGKK